MPSICAKVKDALCAVPVPRLRSLCDCAPRFAPVVTRVVARFDKIHALRVRIEGEHLSTVTSIKWHGVSFDLDAARRLCLPSTIMIAPRVPSRHRASVMAASNVVTTITVANHFGKTEVPVRVMLANEVPASQKMHSHFVVDLLLNALLRGYLRARACGHTLRGAGSLDGFPELKLLCDLDAAARLDMPTEHRPDTLFRCAGDVVAGCACCGTRCDCVVWPWVLCWQRTCGVPERPAIRAHHAAAHA